ncbi:HNH endonuclease [Cochlodiniinecator piscidefendens]|uniref:HNH endonuclease n=1 Tax=Cochlodiniinecator piscidefendens TaxID=2715756 RepID=UPI00140CFEC3|nr:HNH endonuclease [Cochlodiniinecator piscidefendens]
MRGRWIKYSSEELEWIEAHKEDIRQDSHAEFCKLFSRADVSLKNYNGLCKRKGWKTGRTGCFSPGQKPWNTGKNMPFNAASAKTQFKKGQRPHNTKYEGHERLAKGGYVEISIKETNPHTGFERRYVLKHKYLWEQANGPLAEGMCLKCKDGDKTNTDPSNWEAIPRALLPRLTGRFGRNYDAAEPAVKPIIMAITKLEHKARTS